MLLILLAACDPGGDSSDGAHSASAADTSDSAAADTGDSGSSGDSGDSGDTATETPGFAASGTFRGAAFAVACTEASTIGQYARDADGLQLSATCIDSTVGGAPYVVVAISGDHAGVYVTCAYEQGGANVLVGTTEPALADACVTSGSSAFRVQATAVTEVGDELHFAGSFHYAGPDASTDVSGSFAVNAACIGGC